LRFLSSRWFKISVSLGLFTFLLSTTDLSAFREHLSVAPIAWVIVAFVGYLLGQVLSAYKWRVLARPLGFSQSLRLFLLYYFSGMYLNLFAPSTVAGDLGRSALLARSGGKLSAAAQSVVIDRVSGLVMLLWVCAVGAVLTDREAFPLSVYYGIVAAAIAPTIGWFVLAILLRSAWFVRSQLHGLIEKLIGPYSQASRVLGYACGLSVVFHLFQIGLQLLLALALHLDASLWVLTVYIAFVGVLSNLPISFNGIGIREGGYVMFLTPLGVEQEQALTFGLLWSAIVLVANATGGLALLFAPTAKEGA